MQHRDDILLAQLRRSHLMRQAEKMRLVQSLGGEHTGPSVQHQIIAWTGRQLAALGRHLHKFSQDWELRGNRVYNGENIR